MGLVIEITDTSGDGGLFPVVPSQWKYVYVGEVWWLLGPPTSMPVLTLFSVSSSRGEYPMGDLLIHYEVFLRALTKTYYLPGANSTTNGGSRILPEASQLEDLRGTHQPSRVHDAPKRHKLVGTQCTQE